MPFHGYQMGQAVRRRWSKQIAEIQPVAGLAQEMAPAWRSTQSVEVGQQHNVRTSLEQPATTPRGHLATMEVEAAAGAVVVDRLVVL